MLFRVFLYFLVLTTLILNFALRDISAENVDSFLNSSNGNLLPTTNTSPALPISPIPPSLTPESISTSTSETTPVSETAPTFETKSTSQIRSVPEIISEPVKIFPTTPHFENSFLPTPTPIKEIKPAPLPITAVNPPVYFKNLQKNQKLNGEILIKLFVENAKTIELNLKPIASSITQYLGMANFVSVNHWEYKWDTSKTPNGEYDFFAKVFNEFGTYESENVRVFIHNELKAEIEKETILRKEMEKKVAENIINIEAEKKQNIESIKEKVFVVSATEIAKIAETKAPEEKEKIVIQTEIPKIKERIEEKIALHSEELSQKAAEIHKLDKKIDELKVKETELPSPVSKEEIKLKEEIKKEISENLKQLEKTAAEKEKVYKKAEIDISLATKELREKVKSQEVKSELTKINESLKNTAKEDLKKVEEISRLAEQKKEKFEENIKIDLTKKDTDKDGLSDYDELRLGTLIISADSDGDGFLDGDEVAQGYNPMDPSKEAAIVFEEPKTETAGKIEPKILAVSNIERLEVETIKPIVVIEKEDKKEIKKVKEEKIKEEKVKFSGKAIPNSFVVLYIYSVPIIVTVKTDSEGNWQYVLDKQLSDGKHEVYVAVTDNRGKITIKSEPFVFAKEAAAISILPALPALGEIQKKETIAPPYEELLSRSYLLFIVSLIVFSLGVALVIIGILASKKEKQ